MVLKSRFQVTFKKGKSILKDLWWGKEPENLKGVRWFFKTSNGL
jgi:hypothetical protein